MNQLITKGISMFFLVIIFISCKTNEMFEHFRLKYPCNIIVNVIGGCEPCLAKQSQFDFNNKDTPTYIIYNTADTDVIKYYSKEVVKQNLPIINDTSFCDSLLVLTHQSTCLIKFRSRNKIDTIIDMKAYSGCPRKQD